MFVFDYASIPNDLGGYIGTTSSELPVPWTANALDVWHPGTYLRLPSQGLTHIGSLAVTLPDTPGTYHLDALNANESDRAHGARFTIIALPWPAPREYWSAFAGEIEGDPYTFHVVPEAGTLALAGLAGLLGVGHHRKAPVTSLGRLKGQRAGW
jgi:hypothetical protein